VRRVGVIVFELGERERLVRILHLTDGNQPREVGRDVT